MPIVGTKSEADAKDQAKKLWTNGPAPALNKAKESAQEGGESDVIWEWRSGRRRSTRVSEVTA